ncbi:hypothetical protein [Paenibacillus prosopidis]|uniref:hypothetical protein n=1 Tax=Paenibacillus prosopidis TaxID=630520 RepID=UPI001FE274DE|nr:hypothetical protein [Paenibacillus prosopidis]
MKVKSCRCFIALVLRSAGFTLGGYAESNPAETGKAAREALSMLARKEIHAEIHGVYPLEKAAEALTLLEQKTLSANWFCKYKPEEKREPHTENSLLLLTTGFLH